MASRGEVSFYRDLLYKEVVDCHGHRIGAVSDLAAGPCKSQPGNPAVQRLVIRPHRVTSIEPVGTPKTPLILPWELVEALEPRHIRLCLARAELTPSSLAAGQILLRRQIMDQQVVDCRGLKLQRVNDIAMGFSDGALCLWGMDTGISGFLRRLGDRWGFFDCLRPFRRRLRQHVIRWDFVDRLDPARGHIRLRLSRDEVRSAVRRTPEPVA
jgi:sporulation protein YlmC with PRC-barrel domain